MNDEISSVNSRQTDIKKDQILVMRLPADTVIMDGANVDIDKLPDSLWSAQIRAAMAPLTEVQEPGQPRPVANVLPEQAIRPRKHRRFRWVHAINITFVIFVTLTAVVPAALSSFFGIAIYASNTNSPGAKIYRNDLMISKIMPVNELNTNDVLLLHNDNTWALEVRQVVSRTLIGEMSTLATSNGINTTENDSYTIGNLTRIHKVIQVVPAMGYWLSIFTSVLAKIGVGLILIALNVSVQVLRARRRRRLQVPSRKAM